MIVKLKCVDSCDVKYITTGKVYEAAKLPNYYHVFDLLDDTGFKISVSTENISNNAHGKWEIVKE